jgi:hypothetical protein
MADDQALQVSIPEGPLLHPTHSRTNKNSDLASSRPSLWSMPPEHANPRVVGIRRTGNEPKRTLLVVWRRTHKSVRAKGKRSGLRTDVMTSGILHSPKGNPFSPVPHKLHHTTAFADISLGVQGRIEIEIPFNAPPERVA